MEEEKIVGHKTMADGSHQPLYESEANAIIEASDRAKEKRACDMPDEKSAIEAFNQAFTRLKELGWSDAQYCPKDGSEFNVIEVGSTGIHRCHYSGEWPKGYWMVHAGGDLWPSRPVLFRLDPEKEAAYKARMKED